MLNTVIFGGGGHAKVVLDVIAKDGSPRVIGVIDGGLPLGTRILRSEVIGRDEDLPELVRRYDIDGAIICIGDNALRGKVAASVREMTPALAFPNAIHPSAQIGEDVELGQGNVIMAGCIVNSSAAIGDFCILNTNCSLDHDSRLGDFASLGPNSCVGGLVNVGEFSAICLGANVVHNISIGSHTVVGAGATVLSDLPDRVLAHGAPARIIRPRTETERYL